MTGFASRPGAVLGDDGTPMHYGSPIAEQRTLIAGAHVALPAREIVELTGPDRLPWLDSISSQEIARLAPGVSAESLILSPTGRIEHAMRLVDDGETLRIIVGAGEAAPLIELLTRMRFRKQVELSDASARLAVVGWWPSGGDALGGMPGGGAPASAVATWEDPWPAVVAGGHRYGDAGDDWQWRESIVPRASLESWSPDGPVAGWLALEALRIAAGRPSTAEVDEATIPHELDWLATAVHLAKGCYRGQETVAKVHNLGAPPRRLVLLHLDGSESQLPVAGDEVHAGESVVGRITAAALHHQLGPIALAVVKRGQDAEADLVVPTGDPVVLVAAAQEVLVPASAGREHKPPRMPRLGRVTRPTA